jgi:hypothetical protein
MIFHIAPDVSAGSNFEEQEKLLGVVSRLVQNPQRILLCVEEANM